MRLHEGLLSLGIVVWNDLVIAFDLSRARGGSAHSNVLQPKLDCKLSGVGDDSAFCARINRVVTQARVRKNIALTLTS